MTRDSRQPRDRSLRSDHASLYLQQPKDSICACDDEVAIEDDLDTSAVRRSVDSSDDEFEGRATAREGSESVRRGCDVLLFGGDVGGLAGMP